MDVLGSTSLKVCTVSVDIKQHRRKRRIMVILTVPKGHDPLSITVIWLHNVRLAVVGNHRPSCHHRTSNHVMLVSIFLFSSDFDPTQANENCTSNNECTHLVSQACCQCVIIYMIYLTRTIFWTPSVVPIADVNAATQAKPKPNWEQVQPQL